MYAHLEVVRFMALGLGPFARGRRRQLMRRNAHGLGFVYMHSRVKLPVIRQAAAVPRMRFPKWAATVGFARAGAGQPSCGGRSEARGGVSKAVIRFSSSEILSWSRQSIHPTTGTKNTSTSTGSLMAMTAMRTRNVTLVTVFALNERLLTPCTPSLPSHRRSRRSGRPRHLRP